MSREDQLVRAVARLASVATGSFDADELLTTLCQVAVPVLGVDGIGVMIVDQDPARRGRSRFVHAEPQVVVPEQLQEALQEGPCREAIESTDVVSIHDVRTMTDRWAPFVASTLQARMLSVLAVPLVSRGTVWGTIDLYRHTAGPWTQQDVDLTRLLADVAVSYLVMASDRDEARDARAELEHRSLHDPLTGLPNRALLFDRIRHGIAGAQRRGTAIAIAFVDLDGFKAVNDTLGHGAGDDVLREVAQRLRSAVRVEDTLARLAGDEFVVVCTDLPSDAASRVQVLTALSKRIGDALAAPVSVQETRLAVTASIGISITTPRPDHRAEDLLHRADVAMYRAKHTPGTSVEVRIEDDGDRAG